MHGGVCLDTMCVCLIYVCVYVCVSDCKCTCGRVLYTYCVCVCVCMCYIPLISRVRGPYGKLWTEFFPSFYGPSAKCAGHENKEGKNEDP